MVKSNKLMLILLLVVITIFIRLIPQYTASMNEKDSEGFIYPTTVDSLYWMHQADNILENGVVWDSDGNDMLVSYPAGKDAGSDTGLSYLLALFSLISSVVLLPVTFSCLLAIILFLVLDNLLKCEWSAFISSLFFCTFPIFVVRSKIGYIDTDVFVLLFPLLIFYFFMKGMEKKEYFHFITAGVLFALFTWFWIGWTYLYYVTLAAFFIWFVYTYWKKTLVKKDVYLFLSYFITHNILITILREYDAALNGLIGPWWFFFLDKVNGIWPDAFSTIAEQSSISLHQLVTIIGIPAFLLIFIGMFFFFKEFNFKTLFIGLWILSVCTVIFSGSRYLLLLLFPITLILANFIKVLLDYLDKDRDYNYMMVSAIAFITILVCFNLPMVYAANKESKAVLNTEWIEMGKFIRENTEEDKPIIVWWDWGYHIKYLAERPVFSDGGTQNKPETYWVSRMFLAPVNESVNVIRLLSCKNDFSSYTVEDVKKATEQVNTPCTDKMYLLFYSEMQSIIPQIGHIATYNFEDGTYSDVIDIRDSPYVRLYLNNESIEGFTLMKETRNFKLYEVRI